ncbi:Transposase [Suttonella ornithocola]|uniref:Transposase n=1 Tax=Suttonella ornithocola TaxID=279832 RepID=A0A380MQU7_9GAMM|nr:Transposase [Suttonella ornithocola]
MEKLGALLQSATRSANSPSIAGLKIPIFTERKPSKIDDEALLKDIEQYPDDYQWESARRFNCSQSAICYALKRLKITHKKRLTNIQKPTQRKESTFKNK